MASSAWPAADKHGQNGVSRGGARDHKWRLTRAGSLDAASMHQQSKDRTAIRLRSRLHCPNSGVGPVPAALQPDLPSLIAAAEAESDPDRLAQLRMLIADVRDA